MSYSKGVFYVISRCLMLPLINVFGAIVSTTLFAWILNLVIPSIGDTTFKERLFSSGVWSVLAWGVIIVTICVLLYSDGKRHSAYGYYDVFVIGVTAVFMLAVYFVPVLFFDKTEDNLRTIFEGFYFPCKWLLGFFGDDYVLAVLVGILPPTVLGVLSYIISHTVYEKRYSGVDFKLQKKLTAEYDERQHEMTKRPEEKQEANE